MILLLTWEKLQPASSPSCWQAWSCCWTQGLTSCFKLQESVQFRRSVLSDSLWPHGLQHSLSSTKSQSLLKLLSTKSVMPSNYLILCRPLLLPPSRFPSIRVFSSESVICISWPNYWSFSFSISPSNEYLGLISFRIDWLNLLAVQGTLKSLLQHHSSQNHHFFSVLLYLWSNSHIHTWLLGKNIPLTRLNLVG